MKDVEQVFSRNGYQCEESGHKERVKEAKYGGCILYLYMKIEE
jgi:hypothetical protein